MLGGIVWVLLLPLNQYSRQTYISENALLPGQVHTYFTGSEQNVFRAYKLELADVLLPQYLENSNDSVPHVASSTERTRRIQDLFRNAGISKTAKQAYIYQSSGKTYAGENVYGILHAPRGDGTEAIVLVAALKNAEGLDNLNGVALLVSLARYFKRWSLWSKDIIFLVAEDSEAGPQAWIDAYHSEHDPSRIDSLPLKSGALQGAVCIDYPFDHRFESIHISYDGINGQLPNLDLLNTAVSIASGQMGIGTSIQHVYKHDDSYRERLRTLVKGMMSQALGHDTGPHSVFMPYHIDAITLTTVGEGWQDEMALGRSVESICRSLNNLLEHLHQSFFFYLLMQTNRFVSIGTYLPSAMAVAAGYTVVALWLWWRAGLDVTKATVATEGKEQKSYNAEIPTKNSTAPTVLEGKHAPISATPGNLSNSLIPPLTIAILFHTIPPLVPIYVLTQIAANSITQSFFVLSFFSLVFPVIVASALPELKNSTSVPHLLRFPELTDRQHMQLRSLSLLWTGACLTVLATLNFSLSMFLGVAGVVVPFCGRNKERPGLAGLQYLLLVIMSPMGLGALVLAYAVSTGSTESAGVEQVARDALTRVAFGWNVLGSWGILIGVWVVWWPAWLVSAMSVASSWYPPEQGLQKQPEMVESVAPQRPDTVKHMNPRRR